MSKCIKDKEWEKDWKKVVPKKYHEFVEILVDTAFVMGENKVLEEEFKGI